MKKIYYLILLLALTIVFSSYAKEMTDQEILQRAAEIAAQTQTENTQTNPPTIESTDDAQMAQLEVTQTPTPASTPKPNISPEQYQELMEITPSQVINGLDETLCTIIKDHIFQVDINEQFRGGSYIDILLDDMTFSEFKSQALALQNWDFRVTSQNIYDIFYQDEYICSIDDNEYGLKLTFHGFDFTAHPNFKHPSFYINMLQENIFPAVSSDAVLAGQQFAIGFNPNDIVFTNYHELLTATRNEVWQKYMDSLKMVDDFTYFQYDDGDEYITVSLSPEANLRTDLYGNTLRSELHILHTFSPPEVKMKKENITIDELLLTDISQTIFQMIDYSGFTFFIGTDTYSNPLEEYSDTAVQGIGMGINGWEYDDKSAFVDNLTSQLDGYQIEGNNLGEGIKIHKENDYLIFIGEDFIFCYAAPSDGSAAMQKMTNLLPVSNFLESPDLPDVSYVNTSILFNIMADKNGIQRLGYSLDYVTDMDNKDKLVKHYSNYFANHFEFFEINDNPSNETLYVIERDQYRVSMSDREGELCISLEICDVINSH